jgi:hypothetical protein
MDFVFLVRVAEQGTQFLADHVTVYPPMPPEPRAPYFLVFHRDGELIRRAYGDLYSQTEMDQEAERKERDSPFFAAPSRGRRFCARVSDIVGKVSPQ